MKLAGKVTLVTGGGKGIGEAICVAYGAEGAAVVVADLDLDGARRVLERIRSAGGTATSVEVDVARAASVDAMAEAVIREHGRIDVLVNNAGVRTIKGFLEHTEEDWNRMLAVNLTGPFLCSRAVLPSMLETGKGKIINLASIASFVGRPDRTERLRQRHRARTHRLAFQRQLCGRFRDGPRLGQGNPRRALGAAGGRSRRRRVSRLRRLGFRQRGGNQGRRRLARRQDAQRGASGLIEHSAGFEHIAAGGRGAADRIPSVRTPNVCS